MQHNPFFNLAELVKARNCGRYLSRSYFGTLSKAEYDCEAENVKGTDILWFTYTLREDTGMLQCGPTLHFNSDNLVGPHIHADRSDALIYAPLLRAVMYQVMTTTFLCLWKGLGINKDVAKYICEKIWLIRKAWMP